MTKTVEEKLVTMLNDTNARYGSRLTADETIRARLGKEIRSGMEKAFTGCRGYGEKIAYNIMGLTKDWSKIRFDRDSPILNALRTDFEPDVQALALDLAKEIRDSGCLTLTKKDMNQMRQTAKEQYREQVRNEVARLLQAETIHAKEKAQEIFSRLPKMLDGKTTFDDIIAEQFTEMLAQDVKLEYNNREEARLEARRYAVWRSAHEDDECYVRHTL